MSQPNSFPPVIDVHTHVFNARYLPLKGIFLSFIHDPGWMTKKLAGAIARLIEESTGTSYESAIASLTGSPLREQLADEVGGRVATEFVARVRGTQAAARSARAVHEVGYITDRLADDPMVQALVDLERAMAASNASVAAQLQVLSPEFDAANARLATLEFAHAMAPLDVGDILDDIVQRIKRAVIWGLEKLWTLFDKAMTWWDTIEEFLTFVWRLLMAELEILEALRKAYASIPNVTLVHLMMDMQLAYEPPDAPRYDFDEQVRRMRLLADDSGGVLFGFTAFDPRRTGGFTLPERFLGAKFYPAMGYRPAENDDSDVQASLDAFFRACVTFDTPVFTHCTPKGFQARAGTGVNAHPKYWASALDSHPNLRLCLGHAGGGSMSNGSLVSAAWFAENEGQWNHPDNFGARVVDLCRCYERVYCEFGHLDEVLHGDAQKRGAFERNFVREWTSTAGPYAFATKCMFGSDHHMPRMVNHAAELLAYFRDVFERSGLNGFEDFCGGTARRYLKLAT